MVKLKTAQRQPINMFVRKFHKKPFDDCYLPNALAALDRIIKPLCLYITMSLSHKRVERSTGRNFPPIFTKLAMKVQSKEMSLPIVFDGNWISM